MQAAGANKEIVVVGSREARCHRASGCKFVAPFVQAAVADKEIVVVGSREARCRETSGGERCWSWTSKVVHVVVAASNLRRAQHQCLRLRLVLVLKRRQIAAAMTGIRRN